ARAAGPGNLRAPLHGLIGRDGECRRARERLAEGRLVTLVGPGGVGKTRLATAVAAQVRAPGGIWVAELAAAASQDDVAATVGAALGLRATGLSTRDPLSRLTDALGGAAALLVLDNCEHVIEAAAWLAEELLGRCPGLRVLATGREPLGITGELLVPVLPLDPGAAVELFTERARAVRPGFALTDGSAHLVAGLCQRLDGLPLAIELAAARLRTLPLEWLAARLDDRFALLTGGSRTAQPRHQALSSVVAWSWDLLSEAERGTARRLAAFAGGFTPEAAEWLDAAPDPLVEKSLVQFDGGRYRMLETIREFVREHTDDPRAARAAHAAYFRDLAEEAEPWLRAAGQLRWLERLTPERANFLAALDFSCGAEDAETAVRLASALGPFWAIRGEYTEAAAWLGAALRLPGKAPEPVRASATAQYLFFAWLCADTATAREATWLPEPTDPLSEGLVALVHGETEAGLAALGVVPDHPWKQGMYALVRSLLHGQASAASDSHRELLTAADGFRTAGDRWGLATTLTYAAITASSHGDFAGAMAAIEEALKAAGDLGSDMYQRVWRSSILLGAGATDRARAELTGVVAADSGLPGALASLTLADLTRHDGDPEAAECLLNGTPDAVGRGHQMVRVMLWSARGRLALHRGHCDEARGYLQEAVAVGREAPGMGMIAHAAVGAAMLAIRHGGQEGLEAAALLIGVAARWASGGCDLDARRLDGELRELLGESAYTAAFERGRDLDRAEALALVSDHVLR
ncbi:ATP-binding protein, partial [Streptomyces boncukensis]